MAGKLFAAWEKLYKLCDGIIFVLDSADQLRLCVAREELAMTLSHEDIEHRPVPILILANKKDLGKAIDCEGCTEVLRLNEIHKRRWRIYSSNAVTGEGLTEAISWFTGELKCIDRGPRANKAFSSTFTRKSQ